MYTYFNILKCVSIVTTVYIGCFPQQLFVNYNFKIPISNNNYYYKPISGSLCFCLACIVLSVYPFSDYNYIIEVQITVIVIDTTKHNPVVLRVP